MSANRRVAGSILTFPVIVSLCTYIRVYFSHRILDMQYIKMIKSVIELLSLHQLTVAPLQCGCGRTPDSSSPVLSLKADQAYLVTISTI